MPTKSEFENAFANVAEGRDPDEDVFVGGEWLPAIRVVREMRTSMSIMPNIVCGNVGLEQGSTYAQGNEEVLRRWKEDGLIA